MRININSGAVSRYTRNLENLSSRAIPYAVKATLNNAAFDMKKTTLHKSVKNNFDGLKAPQFFKRYSGVNRASGNSINHLKAIVGMLDMGNPAARKAVENLDKQETGGIIDDGFAYLKSARASNSLNKFVRRANYYDKNKIISGRSNLGRGRGTNKSKFVARAAKSYKEKKPLFINSMKGNFVAQVTSFKKTRKGKVKIKMKLLMKERERVNIKATHFMKEAALESQSKMHGFYITEVEKQINRLRQR